MKLLLTSTGFTSQIIVDACVQLANKPAAQVNIAVINEGYAVEPGDHSWVIEELATLKRTFGGTIELINLLALDINVVIQRINTADVIYVVGGNTDYLMHIYNRTGFSMLLPELLETKVYVGSSAGSMVMGKRISTISYQNIFGEAETYGVEKYLELVDFAIKPHLNSLDWPNNRVDKLLTVSKDFEDALFGLSDSSAVSIEGNEIILIGTDWVKILNGTRV